MRSRRLLQSIVLLPTISEMLEDAAPLGCPSTPACPPTLAQSLDEYVNSIKELAQPGWGPVRVARSPRPRLFSKPLGKASGSGACAARCANRALRTRSVAPGADDATCRAGGLRDWGTRDPLDWLFAQTQTQREEAGKTEPLPAALRLM